MEQAQAWTLKTNQLLFLPEYSIPVPPVPAAPDSFSSSLSAWAASHQMVEPFTRDLLLLSRLVLPHIQASAIHICHWRLQGGIYNLKSHGLVMSMGYSQFCVWVQLSTVFSSNRSRAERWPVPWDSSNKEVANCWLIRFHMLVAESQWNDEALIDTFYLCLSEEVRDRLITIGVLSWIKELLDPAVKVNNHWQDQEQLCKDTKQATQRCESLWVIASSVQSPQSLSQSSSSGVTPCVPQEEPAWADMTQCLLKGSRSSPLGCTLLNTGSPWPCGKVFFLNLYIEHENNI